MLSTDVERTVSSIKSAITTMITRDSPSPRPSKYRSRSPLRRRHPRKRRRTRSPSPSRSPRSPPSPRSLRYRSPSRRRSYSPRRRYRTPSPTPSRSPRRRQYRRRSPTPSSYTSSSYDSTSRSPSPTQARTVFVSQISPRAQEADLAAFFSRVGRVRRVRLVSDRTGRHKGAAYVEFYDSRDVRGALSMTGKLLLSIPVAVRRGEEGVQPTVGWSQRQPRESAPVPQLVSIDELRRLLNPHNLPVTPVKQGPTRIYVGSISFNVLEADLRAKFEPFGSIISMAMPRDATGKLRGYAFIEYSDPESARKALGLDGVVIAGRALKVALAGQEGDMSGVSVPLPGEAGRAQVPLPGSAGLDRVPLPIVGDVPAELDEGRDGGVSMNAQRRVMLMQQLSRGEALGAKLEGDINKLSVMEEHSRSLLLSNMFDPASEPRGFENELAEDVRDECMAKYGTVTHLHVEGKSHGIVYIRFATKDIAAQARSALHGRWFGGKKISAAFVKDGDYEMRFPKAK